jgi:hypothetical protein
VDLPRSQVAAGEWPPDKRGSKWQQGRGQPQRVTSWRYSWSREKTSWRTSWQRRQEHLQEAGTPAGGRDTCRRQEGAHLQEEGAHLQEAGAHVQEVGAHLQVLSGEAHPAKEDSHTSWRPSWKGEGGKTCRKQVQLLGQLLDQLEYQLRANKRVCRESRQQVRTPAESPGTTGVTRSKGGARAPSEEGRTGLPKQRGTKPAGRRLQERGSCRGQQQGPAGQARKPGRAEDSWQRGKRMPARQQD